MLCKCRDSFETVTYLNIFIPQHYTNVILLRFFTALYKYKLMHILYFFII